MSLDGCIATSTGESQWITGEAARAHGHRERARADAILVGGGTLRADEPRLDVRLPGLEDALPAPYRADVAAKCPRAGTPFALPKTISGLEGVRYLMVEGGAQTALCLPRRRTWWTDC